MPLGAAVGALAGLIVAAWTGIRTGVEKGKVLVRENEVLKAELALPASVERAPPVKQEKTIEESMRETEVVRCDTSGGVPVTGEGWRVVCLKPDVVEWRSLHRSAESTRSPCSRCRCPPR